MQRVSVVDQAGDAAPAYRRRFGGPLTLTQVSSLPRARTVTPPQAVQTVQRNGDLVSSQVDLNGLELTWLGLALQPPRLALRLQRAGSTSEIDDCGQIDLVLDGKALRLPAQYKLAADTVPVHETLQAELDEPKLAAIVAAHVVHLKACGLTRRLTYAAALAGSHVLKAYRALVAEGRTGLDASAVAAEKPSAPSSETSPSETDGGSGSTPGSTQPSMSQAWQ